ncbi:MAG: helix-turn-helix domain-containing protein [Pyrinomonadaceae bacterium]|nr:helix-turn-helix domain-containing protein [Pyrinomonadaceae bacterium]MCX7640550.1 helix-turn-helix domain-containing protein [Pyrinomonadaceae bacterium]MDW8303869.1 helix-turn-helix domain-containing protein [Acidobacteriota bacterium]
MVFTVGEKLKKAREARGMSISQVAEQTRISAHYIEAIENNDFSVLPGGVFNKGFIKLYARCVGADEQEIVQDYLRQVSQKHSDEELKIYKPQVLIDDNKTSKLPAVIIAIILIGLVAWGVFALMNYFQNQQNLQNIQINEKKENQNQTEKITQPENQPIPIQVIKLEFRTSAERVSVEATVDGRKIVKDVLKDTPEVYTAQENLKIRYYKGFSDQIQLNLNGKQIMPPPAPKNRNSVEIEINKQNISRILETGNVAEQSSP